MIRESHEALQGEMPLKASVNNTDSADQLPGVNGGCVCVQGCVLVNNLREKIL